MTRDSATTDAYVASRREQSRDAAMECDTDRSPEKSAYAQRHARLNGPTSPAITTNDLSDNIGSGSFSTRQLMELGGLIVKAGLVALTDDDRAVIFGLLVDAAATLRSDKREHALALATARQARVRSCQ